MNSLLTNGQEQGKSKKQVHRLTDMVVEDVDLVDRAANKRHFLLFKREGSMTDTTKVGVTTTDEGEVIAVQVSEADVESASDLAKTEIIEEVEKAEVSEEMTDEEKEKLKEEEAKAEVLEEEAPDKTKEEEVEVLEEEDDPGKMKEEEKAEVLEEEDPDKTKEEEVEEEKFDITAEVQGAMVSKMEQVTERLMGVQSVLRAANVTTEKLTAPLPNKIYSEINEIAGLIKSLLKPEMAQTEKFDSDESSLRNLLKQAGIDIPSDVREAVTVGLRSAIERLLSIMRDVKGIEITEEKAAAPLPKEMVDALLAVAADLASLVEQYPSPASKSDAIVLKLNEHFDGIQKSVEGIRGLVSEVLSSASIVSEPVEEVAEKAEEEVKEEEEMEGDPKKTEKKDDDRVSNLETKMDEIVSLLNKAVNPGAKPKKDVIPASNADDADSASPVEKRKENFVWPYDLAKREQE